MTKNLLYKEFKLCPVQIYMFLFLSALFFFVPSYPKFIGFYYILLCEYLLYVQNQQTNDMLFTATLPIAKKEVVKARFLFFAVLNIIYFVVSIPLGIISNHMIASDPEMQENFSSYVVNVGFYGLQLIIAGITSFGFLSFVYRKANNKYILEFILSSVIYWVFSIGIVFIQKIFPEYLLTTDLTSQLKQLPLLAAGILVWAAGFFFAYKIAAKQFEKLDL